MTIADVSRALRAHPALGPVQSAILRYGVAVLGVGAALLAQRLIDPHGGTPAIPLLLFGLAVTASSAIGGFGPGLLATVAGGLLTWGLWSRLGIVPHGAHTLIALQLAVGGSTALLAHALRDSRERSRASERALHTESLWKQRILETASEGIWAFDDAGRTIIANRAMAALLGVESDVIDHADLDRFVDPEDRALIADVRDRLRGGRRQSLELRLTGEGGSTVWTLASFASITDDDGRHVGTLATFTDLSRVRRAEERLAKLLATEQRARVEAEAANHAKDEFLATLSHELRTPLNAIIGWLAMLRSGKLDRARREHALEVTERNARTLSGMVGDLLDVSRLIGGKLSIRREVVTIDDVVAHAIEDSSVAARDASLTIERRDPGTHALVIGDPKRLGQVVRNLLSNAIKFTPPGGRISVTVRSVASAVEIEIEDTGKGIEPELLPRIFERFRAADTDPRRTQAGLGLGLAIVRSIVEQHGGEVHASSPGPGKGSTFRVRLPRAPADAVPASGPPREVAVPVDEAAPLWRTRVLVVDDEPDAREVESEILSTAGALVRSARSADDAFSLLARWRPDVIVSDLAMPQVDGCDLIERVRELPPDRGGEVPAIAVSALTRAVDRDRALRAGFQRHLPKPVEPSQLVSAVREILAVRAARR